MNHFKAILTGLSSLLRCPGTNLLSIVLITLCLVGATAALSENSNNTQTDHITPTSFVIVLKQDVSKTKATAAIKTLKKDSNITDVSYHSPEQGLQELKQNTATKNLNIDTNPLPGVITLSAQLTSNQQLSDLIKTLKSEPYTQHLYTSNPKITESATHSSNNAWVVIVTLFILMTYLFRVNNTKNLERASDYAAVRRTDTSRKPFIYFGIWRGLFSTLFAWGALELLALTNITYSAIHLALLSAITILLSLACHPKKPV